MVKELGKTVQDKHEWERYPDAFIAKMEDLLWVDESTTIEEARYCMTMALRVAKGFTGAK